MADRIYSFLGLAAKAGRVISGEETCERALKLGKVSLLIVAGNASENTRKKFSDACRYRNIEIRFFGDKELLGRYVGKDNRSVVAVNDKGFASRLMEMIDGNSLENGGGEHGKG